MPRLVTIERDYPATAEKMAALGPLADTLGSSVKGVTWIPGPTTTVSIDAMFYLLSLFL